MKARHQGSLLFDFEGRNNAFGLQPDYNDGIAPCDEQRLAVRTPERLVGGADLLFGLTPIDREADGTQELAFGGSNADDPGAPAAGGEDIACLVGLLAVTNADSFRKDGGCAERAVRIDGIALDHAEGTGQIHPLAVGRKIDVVGL
jgi:hypothetical protein